MKNYSLRPSSGQSFLMSLIKVLFPLVLTFTLLISPCLFGITSITTALGQQPRKTCSSFIITRSAIFKSLAPCHFALGCSSGRYSLSQRLQKRSAKNCTFFQDPLYPSALMNTPGGTASSKEPDKIVLGVRAGVSFDNNG